MRYFLEILLADKAYKFAKWCFGSEFEDLYLEELPNAWNKLHDHLFKLNEDDLFLESLAKMLKEWEKENNDT